MLKKKSAKKSRAKAGSATSRPSSSGSTEFAAVFAGLRQVMAAFAGELHIHLDSPSDYQLVTKSRSGKGGPMSFGAVRIGKAYVSYHLVPVYVCPELLKMVSPELKKRMQGMACFNFRASDDVLFAELSGLTRAGLEKFRAKKLL